jgi:hypothetical protein
MNMGTVERATGRWREILPQLGVDPWFLVNKQGPCPVCGGKDRFRWDDRDGTGSYFCNQCGPGSPRRSVGRRSGRAILDRPRPAGDPANLIARWVAASLRLRTIERFEPDRVALENRDDPVRELGRSLNLALWRQMWSNSPLGRTARETPPAARPSASFPIAPW